MGCLGVGRPTGQALRAVSSPMVGMVVTISPSFSL